ncbi:MAG: 2-hydroxyacyl-CoA dehydratase [Planctomycetota bacterium]
MSDLNRSAAEHARARIVARADDLYHDLTLGAVREWRAAHPGRKVIGYLPVYIPREVVHAAGMLPVGLFGGGEMEIVKGDAYFQSYICHIPRSTIELGLNGSYDVLDGIVFPSICDVIRNLSGMWQIMFPDKYVRYFDMPQNFSDAIGGEFYRRELVAFVHDLEQLAGRAVGDAELRRSIAIYNDNRRLIAALYAQRVREPWNVPTSELYLLMRAGNVLAVEEHNAMLQDYLAAVAGRAGAAAQRARVALRGCSASSRRTTW